MPIKELSSFIKSKVIEHKVISDSHNGGLGMGNFGQNTHETNISFQSDTEGASDATNQDENE